MKNNRIVSFLWISSIWLLAALILTDLMVRNFGGMSYFLGLVGFFLGETFIHDIVFVWPKGMLIRDRSFFNDLKDDYEPQNLSSKNIIEEFAAKFMNTIADVKNIFEANRDFTEWRIVGLEKLIHGNLPTFLNSKAYSKYLKLSGRLSVIKSQIRDLDEESDRVTTFLLGKDNPY